MEKWKDVADKEGLIIVGPDSFNSKGWNIPADGPDFIHDLVETLKAKYSINPRRVYLFGHSAGAVFALNLSMMESEYFAATAVHAGSWRDKRELSVLEHLKRKLPLLIFVGDKDAFFPLSSVEATVVALKERGVNVELTVIKGHDHWYYDRAPEINRNVWEFLKRHELNGEPQFIAYSPSEKSGDINAAVKEINALRLKANESMQFFYAKEAELKAKDKLNERDVVDRVLREQISLLSEGIKAFKEAAVKSEQTAKLNLAGNYQQYFSLLSQVEQKRAETLEALRERAELMLNNPPSDSITIRMNEAASRAGRLHSVADELQQKAEAVRKSQE